MCLGVCVCVCVCVCASHEAVLAAPYIFAYYDS